MKIYLFDWIQKTMHRWRLKRRGVLIPAEIVEIVQRESSFCIIARRNRQNKRSLRFESTPLEFDPTFYVANSSINVWIIPHDPDQYQVDTSAIRQAYRAHKNAQRKQKRMQRHGNFHPFIDIETVFDLIEFLD